jgi:hypothetical protein
MISSKIPKKKKKKKKKGCVFLISTWYTRFETQKRLAVFYLSSMVISAFSNIIGLGITKLGGVGGLAGEYFTRFRVVQTRFRVVQTTKEIDMILRNSVAMDFFGFWTRDLRTGIYGLLPYWCVLDSCDPHRFDQLTFSVNNFSVDFPSKQTFLSREQTEWVIKRINDDRGDATADVTTLKEKLAYLMDWRLALYGICFGCATMPAYAFACKLSSLNFSLCPHVLLL